MEFLIWRERDVNYEFGAGKQDIALFILNKMNSKAKQKAVKRAENAGQSLKIML